MKASSLTIDSNAIRCDHALVPFGRVQVPGAEHDREAGSSSATYNVLVAPPVANRWNSLSERRGQQRNIRRDGFELQCDVRNDPDHGESASPARQ